MLHIVAASTIEHADRLTRNMFEARKRVFVDLLKWDVPVIAGRFEVDQFDDDHATYLVIADEAGEHVASTRLLPTLRPHILGSLYPQLCAGPVPQGEDILEITRFCLDRRLNAPARRQARNRLVRALADFAIANRVRRFTGVAEFGWLQQILAFGWRCHPLGLPTVIDGATLGALAIDIDARTPDLMTAAGIFASTDERELRDAA